MSGELSLFDLRLLEKLEVEKSEFCMKEKFPAFNLDFPRKMTLRKQNTDAIYGTRIRVKFEL